MSVQSQVRYAKTCINCIYCLPAPPLFYQRMSAMQLDNDGDIKTQSAPIGRPCESQALLKPQSSAPSYFFSLQGNDAPPFRHPSREARPKLLIGTFLSEDEAVEMIEAAASQESGLYKYLVKQLVDKKFMLNYALTERNFLMSLLKETIDYSARHDFDAKKLSCLLTLYVNAHFYFKWYYWLPPNDLWLYFKEILIRHTIEDSPDGEEVFQPEESYDILTHFHTVYMNNLPLIHILTFGAHRLKFTWPFKTK